MATEGTQSAEDAGHWIENPQFWSLFVKMIANAAEAGGPAESPKVVRSMCEASGTPPERVIAKLKTHLFLNMPRGMQ
jgi:hypothetical protein